MTVKDLLKFSTRHQQKKFLFKTIIPYRFFLKEFEYTLYERKLKSNIGLYGKYFSRVWYNKRCIVEKYNLKNL